MSKKLAQGRAHTWAKNGPSRIIMLGDCCTVCGLRNIVMFDKPATRRDPLGRYSGSYWRMVGGKYTSDFSAFPEDCSGPGDQLFLPL